jgi:hypothetical protein
MAVLREENGGGSALGFDFQGGGGFIGMRMEQALTLPSAFAFRLKLRYQGRANDLQFKLTDASGRNVWWWRHLKFERAADTLDVVIPSRSIEFAWGPQGAGAPVLIRGIEIILAAGGGGDGEFVLESMTLADLSPPDRPLVTASSAEEGHPPDDISSPEHETSWRSVPGPDTWLELDLLRACECGGIVITWEPGREPPDFDVTACDDDSAWSILRAVHGAKGHVSMIPFTPGEYRRIRLAFSGSDTIGIEKVELKPHDFGRAPNDFFRNVSALSPRGWFPRYFCGEQSFWTPAATPEGHYRGLMNQEGAVETDFAGFSIEPSMWIDGQWINWASVKPELELADSWMPVPSSAWHNSGVLLKTTAFATGPADIADLHIRYEVTNESHEPKQVRLFASIRPFQVSPPWQIWGKLGGVSPIQSISREGDLIRVNGNKVIKPNLPPSGFGATTFDGGDISSWLAKGMLPDAGSVVDTYSQASAALAFELALEPGESRAVFLRIPFAECAHDIPPAPEGPDAFDQALAAWRAAKPKPSFLLPASASDLTNTLNTAVAHILVNRDGAALQPGPRRYTRSWIRDGAIMAASLLRMGITQAPQDFLRWYIPFQKPDGNVPCVVDRFGPDWLPEHDSHGQLIFLAAECYRFTRDRAILEESWPAVLHATSYLEALRQTRLTPEYNTPEKIQRRGLLPESASHEGYLAHPVHSYWDDYWAIQGMEDASRIAGVLGYADEETRFRMIGQELRDALRDSIRRVIEQHGLNYVPSSVEWADFDITATACALGFLDMSSLMPDAAIRGLIDEYMAGLRRRWSGETDWNNYTAYEIRIVSALVHRGMRDEATDLLDRFLADRRPLVWNQWPEITWRDPLSPGHLGDLPHSWIGSEFVLSVMALFAHDRASDASLVLAAGIPRRWIAQSVIGVVDLSTRHGRLSYHLAQSSGSILTFAIETGLRIPDGGIVIRPPLDGIITSIEGAPDGTRFTDDEVVLRQVPARFTIHTSPRQVPA